MVYLPKILYIIKLEGSVFMLQPIWIEDKKLICPICKQEVKEYPPDCIGQAKFKCLHCNNFVMFKMYNGLYISWIIDEF